MESEIAASEHTMKSPANHMQEEAVSELHGQLAGLVCSHTGYTMAIQKVPFSLFWPGEGGKE